MPCRYALVSCAIAHQSCEAQWHEREGAQTHANDEVRRALDIERRALLAFMLVLIVMIDVLFFVPLSSLCSVLSRTRSKRPDRSVRGRRRRRRGGGGGGGGGGERGALGAFNLEPLGKVPRRFERVSSRVRQCASSSLSGRTGRSGRGRGRVSSPLAAGGGTRFRASPVLPLLPLLLHLHLLFFFFFVDVVNVDVVACGSSAIDMPQQMLAPMERRKVSGRSWAFNGCGVDVACSCCCWNCVVVAVAAETEERRGGCGVR